MVPSFSFHSQVSGGGSLLNASVKKKAAECSARAFLWQFIRLENGLLFNKAQLSAASLIFTLKRRMHLSLAGATRYWASGDLLFAKKIANQNITHKISFKRNNFT